MRLSLALLVAVTCTGCVAKHTVMTRPVAATPSTDNTFDRMLNPDNGLLVRKWIVADDADRIGAALVRHHDGRVLDADAGDALDRNGLRFVRIRADRTEDLLGELGVMPSDVAAWHGQVLQWRELHQRVVGGSGATVGVSGRVRTIPPGRLRLVGRSWTVLMEDRVYLTLELLPQMVRPQGPSLYQLLGDDDLQGEVFGALAVEVELDPGYAYILTGERPAVEWGESTPGPETVPGDAGDGPTGPDVETPDTLGEFLFGGHTEPPLRTLLVFVPRIPDRLLRPYRVEGATPEGHPVAATR